MSGQRKQTASLESYSASVLRDVGDNMQEWKCLSLKKWIKFGRNL